MNEKTQLITHFRKIQTMFSRFYAVTLIDLNLTLPQYALLNELVHTGTICMSEASKKLQISKPAITNLVDRLEKSAYLKRLPHPKDRRVHLLQVQSKGVRVVRQIQSRVLGILLKTLAQFGAKDQETIVQFYTSLSERIAKVLIHSKSKN